MPSGRGEWFSRVTTVSVADCLWDSCAFLRSNIYFRKNTSARYMQNVLVLTLIPANYSLNTIKTEDTILVNTLFNIWLLHPVLSYSCTRKWKLKRQLRIIPHHASMLIFSYIITRYYDVKIWQHAGCRISVCEAQLGLLIWSASIMFTGCEGDLQVRGLLTPLLTDWQLCSQKSSVKEDL